MNCKLGFLCKFKILHAIFQSGDCCQEIVTFDMIICFSDQEVFQTFAITELYVVSVWIPYKGLNDSKLLKTKLNKLIELLFQPISFKYLVNNACVIVIRTGN